MYPHWWESKQPLLPCPSFPSHSDRATIWGPSSALSPTPAVFIEPAYSLHGWLEYSPPSYKGGIISVLLMRFKFRKVKTFVLRHVTRNWSIIRVHVLTIVILPSTVYSGKTKKQTNFQKNTPQKTALLIIFILSGMVNYMSHFPFSPRMPGSSELSREVVVLGSLYKSLSISGFWYLFKKEISPG